MSTFRSCTFLDHKKTADLGGAHLSFVRHPGGYRARNAFTISRLPLCPEKAQISALVRHPSAEKSTTRSSHNPHPTTYNPPNDASLRYVRHSRPFLTPNPITTSYLPLCPKKRQISPPLRHRAAPRHAFPTTHTPQPTTPRIMKTSATVQGRHHV